MRSPGDCCPPGLQHPFPRALIPRLKRLPQPSGWLNGSAGHPLVQSPCFQADDVPGTSWAASHNGFPAIADHPGMRGGGQVLQGIQGSFRFALLHHANNSVEYDNPQDKNRLENPSPSCQATIKEIPAAISRIMIITSFELFGKTLQSGFFLLSCSLFSPYSAKRLTTSSQLRPVSALTCNSLSTCW